VLERRQWLDRIEVAVESAQHQHNLQCYQQEQEESIFEEELRLPAALELAPRLVVHKQYMKWKRYYVLWCESSDVFRLPL
jgi:hypothetical protein